LLCTGVLNDSLSLCAAFSLADRILYFHLTSVCLSVSCTFVTQEQKVIGRPDLLCHFQPSSWNCSSYTTGFCHQLRYNAQSCDSSTSLKIISNDPVPWTIACM